MKKLYAQRDVKRLGRYYTKHVSAMTSEELHSKADIAAELAWRDFIIDYVESKCGYTLTESKLKELKLVLEDKLKDIGA